MVGLILPGNLWFCPYVNIYTHILRKKNVEYEIVSWCRDGKEENGCIQYKGSHKHSNPLLQFVAYFRYASFVKKTIGNRHYDRLIVFSPQVGIFISGFLTHKYKNNYIFDYRDLSIEQKTLFKRPFMHVLENSALNVISSPGFKKCLPSQFEYIISHNFNIDVVEKTLAINDEASRLSSDVIDVLTIGGIRDYESNVQVIDALANVDDFKLRFVGKGPSAESLKKHSEDIHALNVSFVGYYNKSEEAGFIKGCTFMNIFYPRKISHDTALSNRFYNSLIYNKPMIVTSGTTQGDFVEKYRVGIAISDCNDLANILKNYLVNLNKKQYSSNCRYLLELFAQEYRLFEQKVVDFVTM